MSTLIFPGQTVTHDPEDEPGDGVHVQGDEWIATVTGRVESADGMVHVRTAVGEPRIPQVGEQVIVRVKALYEQIAEVIVLHVEGHPNRGIVPGYDVGEIHVSEIVGRYLSEPRDALSRRDVLRARVLANWPMVKLTTKAAPELGVLYGICPVCGHQLEAELKGDHNVHCGSCDHRGYRALSDGFGLGHVLPAEDDESTRMSELNGEGSRWSKDTEEKRLKARVKRGALRDNEHVTNCTLCDVMTTVPFRPRGDKPVRCSSCMNRVKAGEATEDELAAEQKKLKDGGGGRGGRDGGRDRPRGTPVNCTMCGKDTTVPFEPTAGRPVRCSDCFGKVKDGVATKEELANERELLQKQRAEGGNAGGGKGGGGGGRGGRDGGGRGRGGRDGGGRGGRDGGGRGGRDGGGRGGRDGGGRGGGGGGRGGRGGDGGRDGRGGDGGGRGGSDDIDADREAAAKREEGHA